MHLHIFNHYQACALLKEIFLGQSIPKSICSAVLWILKKNGCGDDCWGGERFFKWLLLVTFSNLLGKIMILFPKFQYLKIKIDYYLLKNSPRPGGSVVSVSDSWPDGYEFDPWLRQTFFPGYFHLSPLQKHVSKVVGSFGKKSCVSTGVSQETHCVTDCHDMTLAVKVVLNPNTTNFFRKKLRWAIHGHLGLLV